MPNRFDNCKVDISTWPPDEKKHILDLAHKHNTTVDGADDNFKTLMGATEEEHKQTKLVFKLFHMAVAYGFKKAGLGVIVAALVWFTLSIFRMLGFDTTIVAPFVESLFKTVLGG